MIVLDTHAWVWWTIDPMRLSETQRQAMAAGEDDRIGVSAISCWEVAKLCEYGFDGEPRRNRVTGRWRLQPVRGRLIGMTPEFWAILGVGVPVMAVAVSGLVMLVGLQRDVGVLHRDVAGLRERMAKLEGSLDGFMRGTMRQDHPSVPSDPR